MNLSKVGVTKFTCLNMLKTAECIGHYCYNYSSLCMLGDFPTYLTAELLRSWPNKQQSGRYINNR